MTDSRDMFGMIMGIKIFYSLAMDDVKIVSRTWKERLFSLPWKPLQRIKVIHKPYCAIINNNLYAHPSLKEEIEHICKKVTI